MAFMDSLMQSVMARSNGQQLTPQELNSLVKWVTLAPQMDQLGAAAYGMVLPQATDDIFSDQTGAGAGQPGAGGFNGGNQPGVGGVGANPAAGGFAVHTKVNPDGTTQTMTTPIGEHPFGSSDPLTIDNAQGQAVDPNKPMVNWDSGDGNGTKKVQDLANGAMVLGLGDISNGKQAFGENTDLSKIGGKNGGYKDGQDAFNSLVGIAQKKGALKDGDIGKDGKLTKQGMQDLSNFTKANGLGQLSVKKDSYANKAVSAIDAGVTGLGAGNGATGSQNVGGDTVTSLNGAGATVNGQNRNVQDVSHVEH